MPPPLHDRNNSSIRDNRNTGKPVSEGRRDSHSHDENSGKGGHQGRPHHMDSSNPISENPQNIRDRDPDFGPRRTSTGGFKDVAPPGEDMPKHRYSSRENYDLKDGGCDSRNTGMPPALPPNVVPFNPLQPPPGYHGPPPRPNFDPCKFYYDFEL